jgi:hypothetical protein
MAGSLLPQPKQLFQTDSWGPGVGYKIYTYEPGTLTAKATYTSSALTTPNTNPVIANARGEAVMFGTGSYRIILKDSIDVTVWDQDNVQAIGGAADTLRTDLAATTGASLVGYEGTTVDAMLDKQQVRINHKNFAYDYSDTTTIIYDGSTGDGLHRHFGQIAEGIDGRLHLVYGRSPTHGLTAGQTAWHRYSDDGGATWSAETEVIPADALLDQRSLSMCVTPTGRIVLIYAKVLADSTNLVTFGLRYSDDNSETWTQGDDIVTINFTYCRSYGRIKLIPGDSNNTYRLAWTPYYRSGSGPTTYRVAAWYSDADSDGLDWTEGAPIVDDTTGQTECEIVAINAKLWFAVTRGATGLTLYKTTDAGATWSSIGVVTITASDSWVAPTLDKFHKDGSWFLALGYCNRSQDTQNWRIVSVDSALTSAEFGEEIDVATDMVNASGYQCPVTDPNGNLYIEGGTAYVEFKEYVGQVYTQVRFVRIDLLALQAQNGWTLRTIASGAITVPGNTLETTISIDTEGAAATDDLDTINGGKYGQIYVFRGPYATASRDPILKSGTGNLFLNGDFRFNSLTSRLTALRLEAGWFEVSRTDDYTPAAIVITSDAITVPSSAIPIFVLIDTEAAAATDALSTINGGRENQIIYLSSATSSRDPTLDEVGNIALSAAGNCTLTNPSDLIGLIKRGATWYEISRSDNG